MRWAKPSGDRLAFAAPTRGKARNAHLQRSMEAERMTASKFAFRPVSVLAGLVAATIAKKVFARVWGLVDEEEPPTPDRRNARLQKLVPALLLQGAVFAVVRGLVDRGSRHAFRRATGTWPGEQGRPA
jgi:hypothetical protein